MCMALGVPLQAKWLTSDLCMVMRKVSTCHPMQLHSIFQIFSCAVSVDAFNLLYKCFVLSLYI